MKNARLLLVLPCLLAACGDSDIEESDDVVLLDAADGQTASGMFEVIQDGEVVGTTRIEPDGRYTETYPDGLQVTGQMRRESATRVCFDPDGEDIALCFSESDPAADGSYEVVADDGSTAIIRPVG